MKRIFRFMACVVLASVSGLAYAQEAEEASNKIDTSVSLGLTVTDGNSNTTTFNVGLEAKKVDEKVEYLFNAGFKYGEEESTKNVDTGDAALQLNFLLNEEGRFYFPMKVSYFYDDIADVDYRVTAGPPGLGYYFIKSDETKLSGEIAFEYIWEKVGGLENDYAGIRFAQTFEHQLSETAKIFQNVEYIPEIEDFGNYLINAEAGVEAALNNALSLRVSIEERYDAIPAPGKEKSDTTVLAALVLTL